MYYKSGQQTANSIWREKPKKIKREYIILYRNHNQRATTKFSTTLYVTSSLDLDRFVELY